MSLRCIVVDDEPLAMVLLEKYIEQTPGLELAGSYGSAIEADTAIRSGVGQLAFLDIQMPGMTGIELAKVAEQSGVKVVFTTAYRDYAIDGFRVNALDYLLKPVSYSEFLVSANRAIENMRYIVEPDEKNNRQPGTCDWYTVRSNYKNIRIALSDIIYIEGLRDYVKIHLKSNDRPLVTQISLKTVEKELPKDMFIRIHRSFIVAFEHIKSYNRTMVEMRSPLDEAAISLPVGDTYRGRFIEAFSRIHSGK